MALFGVGQDNAGALLVAAGDNPQRLRSEAGFAICAVPPDRGVLGKTVRHRLNRGGDRQANAALYRIAWCGCAGPPHPRLPTRRMAEGKTNHEIIRCLIGRVFVADPQERVVTAR